MKRNGKYLLVPSMVWLAVFFVIPMLIVVAVSFASRTAYGQIVFGWTFQNYARFLDPLYISIFGRTIFIAVVTTVCTILMGYPLAYCIARLPRRLRQKGLILCMIPFWINFLIRSYAWVIILRSQGVLNTILMKLEVISQPIQFLYNEGAVMLGMVYALPLTMPGIAAGTVLVFISSLGMFVVPDVMGGAKAALVGNVIQNQFLSARDWPFGSALSIVLALLSLILIFLYYRAIQAQKGDSDAENMA